MPVHPIDVVHGQADSIIIYVGLSLNKKGLLNSSSLGLMKTNPKANTGYHPWRLISRVTHL